MQKTTAGSSSVGVGLLNKALQLLDQFTPKHPAWTQAELGRMTGMSKSTVNRLVRYFCARGYLVQLEPSGRYGLGPAAIDLGLRASANFDLGSASLPMIEELAVQTLETSLLASYRPGRHEVVCVAQIPSPREGLRVFHSVGSAIPLHAGAISKAVLAFLPEERREAVVDGPLESLTPATITDPAVLRHDLDEIRLRGYAMSREETYPGVYGVGAPVIGPGGSVAGSVAVAAPLSRIDTTIILDHAKRVISTAKTLSERLGGRGVSP